MNLKDLLHIKKEKIIEKKKLAQKIRDSQAISDVIISTNSQNFDAVLGKGLILGTKYLIFGANRTGKTQLAHQMCIQLYKALQDPAIRNQIRKRYNISEGSILADKNIYFFDCENTFRPERIEGIAEAQKISYMNILNMIQISKIYNQNALLTKLKEIQNLNARKKPLLLIIDSLNKYYRAGIADELLSVYKTQKLMKEILREIHFLNIKYNITILATAQVSAVFSDQKILKDIPSGNRYLNHFFSEYIYLQIDEHDKRYAQLVNSSQFPEKKLRFQITERGIEDYNI